MQAHPESRGDGAGEGALVKLRLVESECHRLDRFDAFLRGDSRDERRVHAARQKHANGHIRLEAATHRRAHQRLHVFNDLRLALRRFARIGDRPIAPFTVLPRVERKRERVRRRELTHAPENAQRRGH